MKYVKQLVKWVRLRPFTAVVLAILSTLSIALGVWDGFMGVTSDWKIYTLIGIIGVIMCVSFARVRNQLLACILVASLTSTQVLAGSWGANFCWMNEGYCDAGFAPASEPEPINGMQLMVTIDLDDSSNPTPRIVSSKHIKETDMVSAEEANTYLQQQWGLTWTGEAGSQFTTNGVAATEADMPFSINRNVFPPMVTLYPGQRQYTLVVEASTDLLYWAPVLITSAPSGVMLMVQDLSRSGQTFYRVRLRGPDELFQPAGVFVIGIGLGLLGGGAYICYRIAKCSAKLARDRQPKPPGTNDVTNP
jgi:hypothetical protein